MGRRSQLPRWLSDADIGPLHEESEDSGFIYYGRYFRSADGTTPQPIGPLLAPMGTFSILTLPSDNGTWAVALVTSSGDQRAQADARPRPVDEPSSRRARCMRTGWRASRSATSRRWAGARPLPPSISDGRPLLTGIALLGDACACTNPSLGRGISLGLLHTKCLREVVGSHLDDPLEFAEAWDAATEANLTPWYRETVEEDRDRLHEIDALRNGLAPAPPSERSAVLRGALLTAMLHRPRALQGLPGVALRLDAVERDLRPSRRGRANPRAGRRA